MIIHINWRAVQETGKGTGDKAGTDTAGLLIDKSTLGRCTRAAGKNNAHFINFPDF